MIVQCRKKNNVVIFVKACWIIHIQTCCNNEAKMFFVFSPIHSLPISCETWKLISFQRNYLLKYVVHGCMQIYHAKWHLKTVTRPNRNAKVVSCENRQLCYNNKVNISIYMDAERAWMGQSTFWHWGYFWITHYPRRKGLWSTLQHAPELIHLAAQDIFPLTTSKSSCSRLKNCSNFSPGNGQGWVGLLHGVCMMVECSDR